MRSFKMPENMKLASIWVVWGFLSLGVLGWGLHIAIASVGCSIDMPAWIQAIGSIAAILVAVGVGHYQAMSQRKLVQEEESDRLRKIVGMAKYAGKLALVANVRSLSNSQLIGLQENLKEVAEIGRSIQFVDVPLPEAAFGWVELRHAIRDILTWTDVGGDFPEEYDDDVRYQLQAAANRAVAAVGRIEVAAGGVLTELPSIRTAEDIFRRSN
ncbi:cbb3-type cytochrome c oxidase subunit I [Pseudomonas aeruginosa]|uniref:cbb3-type cytochrome c oxidase subunit I n=1 Tax=Pseudomonas aeruginosa TaxID=287 RepID=UPI0013A52C0A|nr:cbb3-type cytochrome c oxidase subunit I [Pseudomonas aeruginosa]